MSEYFVNISISVDDLKDILVERLEYWINDTSSIEYLLYEQAIEELVDSGRLDGGGLKVNNFVDNFYINDTIIYYSEQDLIDNSIPTENIITSIDDCYLCYAY